MSKPDTSSALSEDASASASKQSAGRRLANRPSSLRRRSKPCSGLRWKGLLSHLGPPTAPNITASLAFALAITASGIAVPSGVQRRAADDAVVQIERHRPFPAEPVGDADDLVHHFGADAVARQDQKGFVAAHGSHSGGKPFGEAHRTGRPPGICRAGHDRSRAADSACRAGLQGANGASKPGWKFEGSLERETRFELATLTLAT